MYEELIKNFDKLKDSYPEFEQILTQDKMSELNRTPFRLERRDDWVSINGQSNGAVYYCSGGVTFYSPEIAAMTMESNLFSKVLDTLTRNNCYEIPTDDIVLFIAQNFDLNMDNHNFIFYLDSDLDCKTSYHHPYICDELNKYEDEDSVKNIGNLYLLTQISQLFHAFKTLINPDSYFMTTITKDIEEYKNSGKHPQYFLGLHYTLKEIVIALNGFINSFKSLKHNSFSIEDDIPF